MQRGIYPQDRLNFNSLFFYWPWSNAQSDTEVLFFGGSSWYPIFGSSCPSRPVMWKLHHGRGVDSRLRKLCTAENVYRLWQGELDVWAVCDSYCKCRCSNYDFISGCLLFFQARPVQVGCIVKWVVFKTQWTPHGWWWIGKGVCTHLITA